MSIPNENELKKLTKMCRRLGIKSFKNQDFEFTLSEEQPVSAYKKRMIKGTVSSKSTESVQTDTIESDSLTQEQLLLWSLNEMPEQGSV